MRSWEAAFDLSPSVLKKTSLHWVWEEHYDNITERVPGSVPEDLRRKNIVLVHSESERRHRSFQFSVDLKF